LQFTQHVNGSKHISAVFDLKDWPSRQVIICESSAAVSEEGPSKIAMFAIDLRKAFVFADTPLFKINNFEVRNFFLKHT
jgi:hypothetical protein